MFMVVLLPLLTCMMRCVIVVVISLLGLPKRHLRTLKVKLAGISTRIGRNSKIAGRQNRVNPAKIPGRGLSCLGVVPL